MARWRLEDLTDYVRGVAPADRRSALEADLAAAGPALPRQAGAAGGLPGLREDIELLREIAAALRQEATPGPSEDTLVSVSSILAAASTEAGSAFPQLPLLTVTDPQAGLYSGFRSAQHGHRDFEIHGERFDLELSVDTPFDAIDVIIVGRLAHGEAENWSIERVPAILVTGGEVLATSVTNSFGEFHVAAQSEADDVELCILIQGVGQIRIPIDRRDPLFPDRS